jgi:hypothetical protein
MARKISPILKPRPDDRYSKSAIDRAGGLLRDLNTAIDERGVKAIDEWSIYEVALAYRTAYWWREQHAKPLSKVAANLRYHVEREHAQIRGRTEVAQRLKRLPTIVGKLSREPTMKLSRLPTSAASGRWSLPWNICTPFSVGYERRGRSTKCVTMYKRRRILGIALST